MGRMNLSLDWFLSVTGCIHAAHEGRNYLIRRALSEGECRADFIDGRRGGEELLVVGTLRECLEACERDADALTPSRQ